ncbi:MAG: arginine--tRNA ligase [Coriobacteriia bacterium]
MRETIRRIIDDAVALARSDGTLDVGESDIVVEIERPRDPSFGEYSTNVAMRLAKAAKTEPRRLAEALVERMEQGDVLESIEVAGPGFINFRLSSDALRGVVARIREAPQRYGRSSILSGQRVQVEFVSANPVGPLHVGHGRWAALGDAIARLLEAAGAEVEREFYINDAGVQMEIFSKSVAARYLELCGHDVEFAEDWYQGAYIADIAREIFEEEGDAWADADPVRREEHFREKAYAQVLDHLRRVLHEFGVDFDVWFSERTLHQAGPDGEPSKIEAAIEYLRAAGHVYEADGAVWFKSSAWGDDKDRVLRKADGSYTYFAADIAYHKDKFDRGFDLVIDLWGADHHGYVKRMEAAVAALGHEGGLEVVIGQLVNLFRAGEAVRMSKRTGEMVTFEELIDEVGRDAARYFFLRRSTDQPLDFDIALATEQSSDNPVYYVQYAHARICSILRKAAGFETDAEVGLTEVLESLTSSGMLADAADLAALGHDAELDLARKLEEYPEAVERAALGRAPHRLTRYAEDLAAAFHQFYTQCRVVGDDETVTRARLSLAEAARAVLADALGLLGVSAPERM